MIGPRVLNIYVMCGKVCLCLLKIKKLHYSSYNLQTEAIITAYAPLVPSSTQAFVHLHYRCLLSYCKVHKTKHTTSLTN